MTVTVVLLIATYILNIIDYLQTIYAVRALGFGIEANPIVRVFLENNCAWAFKIIGAGILLMLMGVLVKIDNRQVWVVYASFAFYCALVLHNLAQLIQFGIVF